MAKMTNPKMGLMIILSKKTYLSRESVLATNEKESFTKLIFLDKDCPK